RLCCRRAGATASRRLYRRHPGRCRAGGGNRGPPRLDHSPLEVPPMSTKIDFGQMTRWWWIRHAPVTVNKGTCYGHTDHPCDTSADSHFSGWAKLLPKNAVWVHSPLRRTKETALAIGAAGYKLPAMQVVPEFIEQHFGDWQGRTYEELKASPESGY